MESGAEDEEQGDGQDKDPDALAGRGAIRVAVGTTAAGPPTLCGDSSLISIWFFLGPVEMF